MGFYGEVNILLYFVSGLISKDLIEIKVEKVSLEEGGFLAILELGESWGYRFMNKILEEMKKELRGSEGGGRK